MFPGCRALTFQDSDLATPGLGLLLVYLVYSELDGTEAGDTKRTKCPFEPQLAFYLPCSYISARPAFSLQSVPTEPSIFETSSAASLKPVHSLILRM